MPTSAIDRFTPAFLSSDLPVKTAELQQIETAQSGRVMLRDNETVSEFEADTVRFALFKTELEASFNVLKSVAIMRDGDRSFFEEHYPSLHKRIFKTTDFNDYRKQLYSSVKLSIDTVAALLRHDVIPLEVRIDCPREIARQTTIDTCSLGIVGKLEIAARELQLKAGGVYGKIWLVKEQLIQQEIVAFVGLHHGALGKAHEIHFGGEYTNALSPKFGIPAGSEPQIGRIPTHLIEACAARIRSVMSPYRLAEHMAQSCLNEIKDYIGANVVAAGLAFLQLQRHLDETVALTYGKIDIGHVVKPIRDYAAYQVLDNPQWAMIDILHTLQERQLIVSDSKPQDIMQWNEHGKGVSLQRWSGEPLFWLQREGQGEREMLVASHIPTCGPAVLRDPEASAALKQYLLSSIPRQALDGIPAKWLTSAGLIVDFFSRMRDPDMASAFVQKNAADFRRLPNAEQSKTIVAMMEKGMPALVPLLVTWNRLETPDDMQLTPMQFAAATGNPGVVHMLIAAGASTTSYGNDIAQRPPLMQAVMHGRRDVVRLLLQQPDVNANIDVRDYSQNTALILAAFVGDAETIRMLVDAHADVTCTDAIGNNALMTAAQRDHLGAVNILIAAMPPETGIDHANRHGYTAMLLAAEYGAAGAVGILRDAGANINATISNGVGLVMLATDANSPATLEQAVGYGLDINAIDGKGNSALTRTAASGRGAALTKLIEMGADLEHVGPKGTALIVAISTRRIPEMVEALCNADASLAATCPKTGRNAIALAAGTGDHVILNILIEAARRRVDDGVDLPALLAATDIKGANIFMVTAFGPREYAEELSARREFKQAFSSVNLGNMGTDTDGDDELGVDAENDFADDASDSGDVDSQADDEFNDWTEDTRYDDFIMPEIVSDHGQVMNLLIDAGASVEYMGTAALKAAQKQNNFEAIVILCREGADMKVATPITAYNLLMTAIEKDSPTYVRDLIGIAVERAQPGGNVDLAGFINARSADNSTPLMFAARAANPAFLSMLLAQPGIDLDATDAIGWTAMMWAAFNGKTDYVKTLVEAGADFEIISSDNKAAQQHAAARGHTDIAAFLERASNTKRLRDDAPNDHADKKPRLG